MLKNKPIKGKAASSIGTKKESSLHRSLKFRYSGADGITEAEAGIYICDACTSKGELIEVQTGNFSPLKEKLKILSKNYRLRLIHPIIVEKYIELHDMDGKLLHRRKSPLKGKVWDLFNALIYAPELPLLKNFCIELALINAVEKRIDDGSGSWRRKGVRIEDRFLECWHSSLVLKKINDYRQFIPFKGKEQFTVKDLAKAAGITPIVAGKAIYVLSRIGLIEKIGKQGRAFLYTHGGVHK